MPNASTYSMLYIVEKPKWGVGKHVIGPVGRPTGSMDPVGRHYIGPVDHEAGS